jgi:hypothetical protein
MAEATFLVTEKGQQRRLVIALYEPIQEAAEYETWVCPIRISGLDGDTNIAICGVSSLHALALSLRFVSRFLGDRLRQGTLSLAFLDGTACTAEDIESYLQPAETRA